MANDTIGIVGGVGPESTILYYRTILAKARERRPDGPIPSVLINSIDNNRMLGYVGRGELDDLAAYLGAEIERLARAGASFGLVASNTPHIVFERLVARSPIPLLSIVECAVAAAIRANVKRIGILGTRFTMTGRFYPEAFERQGLSVIAPDDEDLALVHDRYMNELVPGIVREETAQALRDVVERMKARHTIDALLLGGTELSLIVRGPTLAGLPVFDTTRIHVDAIVERWSGVL